MEASAATAGFEAENVQVMDVNCAALTYGSSTTIACRQNLLSSLDLREWTRDSCPQGILCWHCGMQFDVKPWFIFLRRRDDGKMDVMGNFCSCGCVKTYILKHWTPLEGPRWLMLLDEVVRHEKPSLPRGHPVPRAPDKECLLQFGGSMQLSEFRTIAGYGDELPEHPTLVSLRVDGFIVCTNVTECITQRGAELNDENKTMSILNQLRRVVGEAEDASTLANMIRDIKIAAHGGGVRSAYSKISQTVAASHPTTVEQEAEEDHEEDEDEGIEVQEQSSVSNGEQLNSSKDEESAAADESKNDDALNVTKVAGRLKRVRGLEEKEIPALVKIVAHKKGCLEALETEMTTSVNPRSKTQEFELRSFLNKA